MTRDSQHDAPQSDVLRGLWAAARLMVRERLQEPLIQRLCDLLVEERGYRDAWIGVFDPGRRIVEQAEAGTSRSHVALAAGGEPPPCAAQALASRDIAVHASPPACPACEAAWEPGLCTIVVPIALDEPLAVLVVVAPEARGASEDERELLRRIAGGAALAIQRIRLEAERCAVVDALRVSEDLYRTMVETSPDAITVTDLAGNILAANERAAHMHGSPDVTAFLARGLNAFDLIAPEDRAAAATNMQRTLEEGKILSLEYTLVRGDGTRFPAEMNAALLRDAQGDPRGFIAVIRDVTDRKRAEAEKLAMEEQLRHQQKLESLGMLASSVAHEINTPVNVVMNYAELILRETRSAEVSAEKVANYSREIVAESERIAAIARTLLTFARQDAERFGSIDVRDLVEETLSPVVRQAMVKDQVEVVVDVPAGLPTVAGKRQQLLQVLINLIMNARDAVVLRFEGRRPPREDQVITISARLVDRDGRRWIRTTVEDHGAGIAPDVLGRIFDPFFTTKSNGTGLGLSVSHGIVADHGGTLVAESRVGEGTRLHVELPVEP